MMAAATAVILAIPSTALAATTGSARTSPAPASAAMTVGARHRAASQTAGVATLTSETTHGTVARPAIQMSPLVNPYGCTQILAINDYSLSGTLGSIRITICTAAAVAALVPGGQEKAFAFCNIGLTGTGVDAFTATVACLDAVYG